MTTSRPRSLADDLRARSDDELAALVRRRPDLATPPPGDLGQLAGRSATSASTGRALDHLTRFQLQVLEACALTAEPFSSSDVATLLPDTDLATVRNTLSELRLLALIWGQPDVWRTTASAREALGRFPAGLGPPLDQLGGGDPTPLIAALEQAPPEVVEVVDALTWTNPTGRVRDADRDVTPGDARTPVEWLLARGVLRPLDPTTVVLPREVSLYRRSGRLHREPNAEAPDAELHHHDPAVIDRLAAGTAAELVRHVEQLLDRWAVDAPGVLRSGGLGVRDLRAAAASLDVDEAMAALIVEVSASAGLVATSGEVADEWLPTPAFDLWRSRTTAGRWVELAAAWLESTRVASLVGPTDDGGRVNALTPEADRMVAPDIRRWVLEDLAALPVGTAATLESVVRRHEWRRPRRGGRLRDDLVRWTLHESNAIGVSARGAVSGPARLLLTGDRESARSTLEALLPEPVDHVLLQADLTAVAPGPLIDELARELALLADVESSGGATVYRFSEASVRRALDAGRSAGECHAFLTETSSTPVPQPLSYLIDDVARRHGQLRVGGANAYLRCDDPAALDELMAGRDVAALGLRRLAPTVVVSRSAPDQLLERLRGLGLAPAAESGDGSVLVVRPDARRTGPRTIPARMAADPPTPSPRVAASLVRALRAAERAGSHGPRVPGPGLGADVPRTAVTETLEVLRGAATAGRSVWLGYVDNDGVASERVVDPVTLTGGQLTAYDHRTDTLRHFSIHRVTGVASLD